MASRLGVTNSVAAASVLLLALAVAPGAAAGDPTPHPVGNGRTAESHGRGPSDPAELETFLDRLMAADMADHHVPGAAVSVVRDGRLLFAKGYGQADLSDETPVDPERTIFPTGSVGKVFTWTAVMQLVEQRKLDLDADVNAYLDFRIPDTYPQPITLKHLLTHTSGFEEPRFEVFARLGEDVASAGQWLASHLPARVGPPGVIPAYSNYNAALAGYIVSRVSGRSYEQYLRERVFDPLGMTRSSTQPPLPPELQASAARGYWYSSGTYQAVPRTPDDYHGTTAQVPAGGHLSAATDMARFMIALLDEGAYGDGPGGGVRILEATTARRMMTTLYTPDPRMLGTAHGLFDFSDNGQRTLGHSGGTLGFATLMLLLPEQRLGVYVVYNNEDVGQLTTQHLGFQRAFFDHYLPAPSVDPVRPPADFGARAAPFVGSYRQTRGAYATLEKVGALMTPALEISDPGDGTLLLGLGGLETRLVEVAPLYFRERDGRLGVLFRQDGQGRITHLFADVSPQYAYQKLDWYETAGFNLPLLAWCVLVFLSMMAVALVRAIRARRRHGREPASRRGRLAYGTVVSLSALDLVFTAGVAVMVFVDLGFPLFGVALPYRLVLGLGVVSALLTVGALVATALAWRQGYWGTAFRAYYTVVTASAVGFAWFINNWNLLGWRF